MTLEFDLEFEREAFHFAARGEVGSQSCGVFGPSGSGKSTLLHLLAGLLRPTRGHVRVGGEMLVDVAAGRFVPPHERGVALVFQEGLLFPHLSVAANLRYGARRSRGSIGTAPPPSFDEVLALLELGRLAARRPAELSGGERQRVALGRALLSAPRVLLLDEPLAALDGELKRQILPFLARVQSAFRAPMLYVSHDLGEILQLTDELLVLERGRSVAQGKLLDLVRSDEARTRLLHRGLTNVLRVVVARWDPTTGLTRLANEAGVEWLNGPPLRAAAGETLEGQARHLSLRPEDITLSLAPVERISARNQVRGVVRELIEDEQRYLACVETVETLLVEVSPSAVAELELAPGREVVCLFKSNALTVL